MPSPNEILLSDSGFWIGLFDKSDEHYEPAGKKADYLELTQVLIPWPCLYESLSTRMMKNRVVAAEIESLLARENVRFVDDLPYRDGAVQASLSLAKVGKRKLSVADIVIRRMLDDDKLRTKYFITFNTGDFVDICKQRGIVML
jgi:hypothetical protein